MRKKHDQLSAAEVSPSQQTPPLSIAATRSQCRAPPSSPRLHRPSNRCGHAGAIRACEIKCWAARHWLERRYN